MKKKKCFLSQKKREASQHIPLVSNIQILIKTGCQVFFFFFFFFFFIYKELCLAIVLRSGYLNEALQVDHILFLFDL
jgi:hypothetical protein